MALTMWPLKMSLLSRRWRHLNVTMLVLDNTLSGKEEQGMVLTAVFSGSYLSGIWLKDNVYYSLCVGIEMTVGLPYPSRLWIPSNKTYVWDMYIRMMISMVNCMIKYIMMIVGMLMLYQGVDELRSYWLHYNIWHTELQCIRNNRKSFQ